VTERGEEAKKGVRQLTATSKRARPTSCAKSGANVGRSGIFEGYRKIVREGEIDKGSIHHRV